MPMVLCKQIFLLFFQEHSRPVLETASQTCFTFQHNEKKTDFQTLIVHSFAVFIQKIISRTFQITFIHHYSYEVSFGRAGNIEHAVLRIEEIRVAVTTVWGSIIVRCWPYFVLSMLVASGHAECMHFTGCQATHQFCQKSSLNNLCWKLIRYSALQWYLADKCSLA